jgi:hypothetical protein
MKLKKEQELFMQSILLEGDDIANNLLLLKIRYNIVTAFGADTA